MRDLMQVFSRLDFCFFFFFLKKGFLSFYGALVRCLRCNANTHSSMLGQRSPIGFIRRRVKY